MFVERDTSDTESIASPPSTAQAEQAVAAVNTDEAVSPSEQGPSVTDQSKANGAVAASQNRDSDQKNAAATPADNAAPESASFPPAAGDESGTPSAEELNKMLAEYSAPQQAPTEGEIVDGRVIAISDIGIVVDIGGKSEGLIPAQEAMDADQPINLNPGQTIEVQLTGERKEGYVLLSYQRARRRRVWANLEKAYQEKTNITGRIVDRVKGGLVIDVGVRAFLPASQADLRPVHDLEDWKDRELEVRVLKMNRKRGNV